MLKIEPPYNNYSVSGTREEGKTRDFVVKSATFLEELMDLFRNLVVGKNASPSFRCQRQKQKKEFYPSALIVLFVELIRGGDFNK